jgi:uncharacterized membrane protein (UPF0127 family)
MARLARLPAVALPAGLRLVVAARPRARLLGLAGLRAPPVDVALLLPGCRSVHTFGMRWPLDLVWLDGDGHPARVDRAVPPRRVRGCRGARAVVEVPTGGADALLQALASSGASIEGRAPSSRDPPVDVSFGRLFTLP